MVSSSRYMPKSPKGKAAHSGNVTSQRVPAFLVHVHKVCTGNFLSVLGHVNILPYLPRSVRRAQRGESEGRHYFLQSHSK